MKRILCSLNCLLISIILTAQPCLPEGIIFSSQEDLNQFAIDYPNCTIIEGYLLINGTFIDDLSPLNQIEEIQGDFELLDNSELKNFEGLESLKVIGGSFSVKGSNISNFIGLENLGIINGDFNIGGNTGNPMNFDGLTSLQEIRRDLNIYFYNDIGNPYLTDLLGLSGLELIGGDLDISSGEMLKDLKGLEKIDSIFGNISIVPPYYGNLNIESLEGLNNLRYVGEDLSLEDLNSLKNFKGLENLEYVGGGLNLEDNYNVEDYNAFSSLKRAESLDLINAAKVKDLSGFKNLELLVNELDIDGMHGLSDLSGLSNLIQIGDLYVFSCDSLISLNGLEGVTTDAAGVGVFILHNPMLEDISSINDFHPEDLSRFKLLNNPQLSQCAISMVCEVLNIPAIILEIAGNGIGCQSIEEVQTTCTIIDIEEFTQYPIDLYPNPVIETLYIRGMEGKEHVRIRLFDSYGRLILTSTDFMKGISVSGLHPGIYTIHIYEKSKLLYTGKIQKITF